MRWFSISSSRKFTKLSSASVEHARERLLLLLGREVGREEEHRQLAVGVERVGELGELLAQLVELALLARDLEQRARVYLGQLLHQLLGAAESSEKSSSPSASSTSRFWSASSSVLRVTFSVAMIVRSATSRRMSSQRPLGRRLDVALGTLGGLGDDLLAVLLGLVLVRLGGLARALHDLVGLRARLLQALAVFGEQLLGLRARALGRVDRLFDRLLAPFQRLADAREREP